MKLESPSVSQKRLFCRFQTIIFYNTEMNWICTAWGGDRVPSAQPVCGGPCFTVVVWFFFIVFFNPIPGAAESFFDTVQKKKKENKAFTQRLRWEREDNQPRSCWTWTLEHDRLLLSSAGRTEPLFGTDIYIMSLDHSKEGLGGGRRGL